RIMSEGAGEDKIGGMSKIVKLGGMAMMGFGIINGRSVDNKTGGTGKRFVRLRSMGGEIGKVNGYKVRR
ncbi:hypothetical protein, partial [Staphylococcus hominis]|uniref:hypothetical protein n=1 Tax=Staphylococcus hominis TaxID=1290 RepID=UPI001C92CBA0